MVDGDVTVVTDVLALPSPWLHSGEATYVTSGCQVERGRVLVRSMHAPSSDTQVLPNYTYIHT